MPSLLKRIGVGLTVCLVGTVINTAVPATMYFSQNITTPYTHQASFYWVPVTELLNAVGLTVVMIIWNRVCCGSDSKQNERNNDGSSSWLEHTRQHTLKTKFNFVSIYSKLYIVQ